MAAELAAFRDILDVCEERVWTSDVAGECESVKRVRRGVRPADEPRGGVVPI